MRADLRLTSLRSLQHTVADYKVIDELANAYARCPATAAD